MTRPRNSSSRRPRPVPGLSALASLAILAALLPFGSGARATFLNGRIAFEALRNGNREILVMNADGTGDCGGGPCNITNDQYDDFAPAWSADGTRIAFASNRDGLNQIYTVRPDGTGLTRVTNDNRDDTHPTWSPNGSKIAYTSMREPLQEDVFVAAADGSTPTGTSLVAKPGSDKDPSWSPDGSTIVFASDTGRDPGDYQIYTVPANGSSAPTLIADSHGSDDQPKYSADGGTIVFRSTRDRNAEIYSMSPGGKHQVNVSNSPAREEFDPALSPDGTLIIFAMTADGGQTVRLFTMGAVNGGNVTPLTTAPAASQPAWEGEPGPGATVSPESLDFGTRLLNNASPPQTVKVTNDGGAALVIDQVSIGGANPGDFSKSSDGCSGSTVPTGGSCTVDVTFTGKALGDRFAELDIKDNAVGSPQRVPLAGTAVPDKKTVPVSVTDFQFSPKSPRVKQGYSVQWSFDGPSPHTATDASGMMLFNSGSEPPGTVFTFRFVAAGAYPYRSNGDAGMTGTINVPIRVKPSSGNLGTTFKVTWAAAAPPAGYAFDVQIERPGDAGFSNWMTGVTETSVQFVPDGGTGTYMFRARLRNTGNGASSNWSEPRSISVTSGAA